MLQLGRRRLCRLPSSYVCVSCLASASSRLPSFVPRRSPLRHDARSIASTAPMRETAAPSPPSADSGAAAGVKAEAETTGPPPDPPSKKRKRKKKAPSKESGKEPSKQPESDAERQLKVLQGALTALQNVLTTRGVDVSQIPIPSVAPLPAAKAGTAPKSKAKSKTKSAPEKQQAKQPKAADVPADVPAASQKRAKGVKARQKVGSPAPAPEVSESDASAQPSAPEAHEAPVSAKAKGPAKSRAKPKPKLQSKSKSKSKPKPGMTRYSRQHLARQLQLLEETEPGPEGARPADLGVPFSEMVAGKTHVSRKLPDAFDPHQLSLVPVQTVQPGVPSLSYGLERVLFNRGVYQLQDPRTRVYNFDPYLSEIMPVNEFDFNALKEYVTSSKDQTLISITKEQQKKYTGSTSSMTSMLAHFHYLLSAWREINVSMMSRGFEPESTQFTRIMRAPAAIFLHWKNGTYAIDADKEFDTANILSMLGKSMEKLLTLSKDDYERYRHENSDQITEEERNAEEAFHYTAFQDFIMRSQLDAYDSRMPGTGMFDLKTRAVISIRMDAKGYHKGLGYEIRQRLGQWESFEREYYDMIRSAFLKYSLQVRMGRMDGIFVAFHNTQRIFGFQYIPLGEMDLALHGEESTLLGDQEFKASLKLLNELLNRATQKWPEQSLRLHFETRTSKDLPFMYVFAKPTTDEEIAAVQNAGKASIEAFEKEILGLVKRAAEDDAERTAEDDAEHTVEADDVNEEEPDQSAIQPTQEIDTYTAWQEARQMVEEAMGDDELGVGLVREAIGDALEQSGILRPTSLAESREYVDALLGALTGRSLSSEEDIAAVELNDESTADEGEPEEVSAQKHEPDQASSHTPLHSEVDGPSTLGQENGTKEDLELEHNDAGDSAPTNPVEDPREAGPYSSQTTSTEDRVEGLPTPTNEYIDKAITADSTADSSASEPKELEEEAEEEDDEEEANEAELEDDAEAKEATEDGASPSLEPLKSLIMRMARRIDENHISDTNVDSSMDDASKLKDFERILGRLISQSRTEKPEKESSNDVSGQEHRSESTPIDDITADNSGSSEVTTAPDLQEGTQPPVDNVSQSNPEAKESESEPEPEPESELLGLTLTIKNKVNGKYVARPKKLTKNDKWEIEYEIEEMQESRARKIYTQLKERRRKIFHDSGDKEYEWYKMFQGNLDILTQKGRAFRAEEAKITEGRPLHMVGINEPLQWGDVFRRKPKIIEALEERPDDQPKED